MRVFECTHVDMDTFLGLMLALVWNVGAYGSVDSKVLWLPVCSKSCGVTVMLGPLQKNTFKMHD